MRLRNSAVLAVALLAAAGSANAATRFALTCVGTETGYTIHYEYRWGDSGAWKSASVEPGRWKNHTWDYDRPGENRSPTFQVRYDDDLGNGTNHVITKLESFAAENNNCEAEGKTYDFIAQGNELFIQDSD